jgi:DNA-binding transcriptional LysR family regulator
MSALQSFAAAARHGSFAKAAVDVGLTPSAISRQIALLEDWVQQSLFERVGRRVALTPQGRAYADAITPALSQIRRATGRMLADASNPTINLATLPSFGMRWLAPRLPALTTEHPDLIVNFSARVDIFDFAHEDFDAAIHLGKPDDWPGASLDFLFSEQVIPVVSPALLKRHPIRKPADFLNIPLLVQTLRPRAWQQWFAKAGVIHSEDITGSFEHFLMVAQAVVAGAGAALIPSFMIEPELEAGTLVCPIDIPLASEGAYYLAYPEDRMKDTGFRQLREWILNEAQDFVAKHRQYAGDSTVGTSQPVPH